MFSYFAYGLRIQSEIAIPEFITTDSDYDPQVTIHLEQERALSDHLPERVINEAGYFKLTRTDSVFYIRNVGLFFINAGAKIFMLPAPDVSESLLRSYLVGTVMGILLYQQGLLVLHASAVNIHGDAVAFLGVSGEGKSSAAAAFQAVNYDVMTDDVAPVILGGSAPILIPGFPQIKLSQESATVLAHDFESLSLLASTPIKRGYRPHQEFSHTSLPLKHIYVLTSDTDFGSGFGIERLSHQEAVVELSRHSRPSTLFHKPDVQHFLQCTSLAKACPVYRLKRPRNIALLPELVHHVENHLSLMSPISA
ncbi:serine kinase [Leptolyngbya cf. ectocarpi LEGE 11479]|uniref:Serine kinase n=1 Tax=Leptolyngbya cf. ectocarpi LEGE 11479 TaxID=1828722 RepID=A0A928ZPY9_LEPEC|nr:serine kinase [Leptolyngbya ectocarpi]MBE9065710.1 serine kinase [Leptolyngbya cf. ectocarpi LEGE 11479]